MNKYANTNAHFANAEIVSWENMLFTLFEDGITLSGKSQDQWPQGRSFGLNSHELLLLSSFQVPRACKILDSPLDVALKSNFSQFNVRYSMSLCRDWKQAYMFTQVV